MSARLHVALVFCALALSLLSACDGCASCGDASVVATLARAQGVVEADEASAPVQFASAAVGRDFRLGDAVRTSAEARADLSLAGGGTLHVEPRSVVRFSASPGAQVGIGVEVGGAEVEASRDDELSFTTTFGEARVGRGSRVRVGSGDDARFEVVVGSAQLDADGGAITLSEGDRFIVRFGGAVLERRGPRAPRDGGAPIVGARVADAGGVLDDAAADAADADVDATGGVDGAALPADDGGLTADDGGLASARAAATGESDVPEDDAAADFALNAGESASIHDPSAPTAVRFRFGSACTTGGSVEVARDGSSFSRPLRAAGRRSATVVVPTGTHAYRARCGDAAPFATGTLRVSRDAGTATLPRRAPRNTVDADGRRYTVLYQTLKPIITLRWKRAPQASGYVITIERGGRSEETRTTRPEHTFASGRFDDGTSTFTFRTADGHARTAPTSLRIDFDNATPVAHIESPPARAALSAETTVAGAAGEGATVSVGGRALTTDRSGRFSGAAAPAAGERCLAIRIAHPQRGVHYFLRCGGS